MPTVTWGANDPLAVPLWWKPPSAGPVRTDSPRQLERHSPACRSRQAGSLFCAFLADKRDSTRLLPTSLCQRVRSYMEESDPRADLEPAVSPLPTCSWLGRLLLPSDPFNKKVCCGIP